MSQTLTLARPYARAVFSMARAQQRLPQWSSMLGFAARAVAEPQVAVLIGNPTLPAQALIDVIVPQGDVDPLFTQFLSVLAENRRLAVLPEIAGMFDALRAEDERLVKADDHLGHAAVGGRRRQAARLAGEALRSRRRGQHGGGRLADRRRGDRRRRRGHRRLAQDQAGAPRRGPRELAFAN